MAKDPAFLFYSDNFMSGTMFMSDEQVGKYIRLLCAQHLTGHISEEDMLNICKTRDERVMSKFIKDDQGKFFNERLELEINKRKAYSESRSTNRKSITSKGKKTSKTYVKHMEDENGIEIISSSLWKDTPLFKNEWNKYIAFRKRENKGIYKTKETELVAINKLHKDSGGNLMLVAEAIEKTISNGYTGIFIEKTKTPTNVGVNGEKKMVW